MILGTLEITEIHEIWETCAMFVIVGIHTHHGEWTIVDQNPASRTVQTIVRNAGHRLPACRRLL